MSPILVTPVVGGMQSLVIAPYLYTISEGMKRAYSPAAHETPDQEKDRDNTIIDNNNNAHLCQALL